MQILLLNNYFVTNTNRIHNKHIDQHKKKEKGGKKKVIINPSLYIIVVHIGFFCTAIPNIVCCGGSHLTTLLFGFAIVLLN